MYQDPGFGEYRLNDRLSEGGRQKVLVTESPKNETLRGEKTVSPVTAGRWGDTEPIKSSETYWGMNTGPPKSRESSWGANTYDDQYDINTNLPRALGIIEQAACEEAKESLFCRHLIGMASGEDKEIIAGISCDMARRYELLRRIYYEITNGTLPISDAESAEKPASYKEGLQRALMAAQEAAAVYRSVLFAMRSSTHISMLTEIMTDALRHIGIYNFLYAKHACRGS